MFQKFFTNTIENKFIKSLVCDTPLPLCDGVIKNDIIYKGNNYIYKNNIINCKETGYIDFDTTIKYNVNDTTIKYNSINNLGYNINLPIYRKFVNESAGESAADEISSDKELEYIGGKTIIYNQYIKNGNFVDTSNTSNWFATDSAILSIANGIAKISPTGDTFELFGMQQNLPAPDMEHTYLLSFEAMSSIDGFKISVNTWVPVNVWECTLGQTFQKYNFISNKISKPPSLQQRCWFNFSHSTNPTTTTSDYVQIKNVNLFDLTQMFGAGNEPTTTDEFRAMFPDTYYEYNQGELLTAKCVNISNSYNNITIPKNIIDTLPNYGMSANNSHNYIDLINHKYIEQVNKSNLSSLNWNYYTSGTDFFPFPYFEATLSTIKKQQNLSNIVCNNYDAITIWSPGLEDKQVRVNPSNGYHAYQQVITVRDDTYTNVNSFKSANIDTYLYYEIEDKVSIDLPLFNAQYEIISPYIFGEYQYPYCHYIHNKEIYYDDFTHRYLGEYLRLIKNYYNINLLPYYNCYNYTNFNDISLIQNSDTRAIEISNQPYSTTKLLVAPIKFGKTYTIALENYDDTYILPVLHDELGLITVGNESLSNYIHIDKDCVINSKFQQPFTVSINIDISKTNENITPELIYSYQDYLYLLIQVPANNNSSIVVLEGDYTDKTLKIFNTKNIEYYNQSMLSPLSLLMINTGDIFAYSDRLIEYLLHNVITNYDIYDNNIKLNQLYIGQKPTGIYNDNIRFTTYFESIKNVCKNNTYLNNLFDNDGYMNKDIEKILGDKYLSKKE